MSNNTNTSNTGRRPMGMPMREMPAPDAGEEEQDMMAAEAKEDPKTKQDEGTADSEMSVDEAMGELFDSLPPEEQDAMMRLCEMRMQTAKDEGRNEDLGGEENLK